MINITNTTNINTDTFLIDEIYSRKNERVLHRKLDQQCYFAQNAKYLRAFDYMLDM